MRSKILKKPQACGPVCQTTASTGAGEVVLSPQDGFESFYSVFGGGGKNVFLYFICHQTADEWEVGVGHMGNAATLVRDTVIVSSDDDRAVKFSDGNKDVIHDTRTF